MEVGALMLPPAMVADALTPEAMALLREPPLQLSFRAGMDGCSLLVSLAELICSDLEHQGASMSATILAHTCSVAYCAAGAGLLAEGGAMREVLAAGEQLGAGSCTHGALWGLCAVAGEPMQLSMQVRCCLPNTRPRREKLRATSPCAAAEPLAWHAQVHNRADAGCRVQASVACHAATVPLTFDRPMIDSGILTCGVLSGLLHAPDGCVSPPFSIMQECDVRL